MKRLPVLILCTLFALAPSLSPAQLLAEVKEAYLGNAHTPGVDEPLSNLQEQFEDYILSQGYSLDKVSYRFEDLYGNSLVEHNANVPQVAASTVKIYTALWVAWGIKQGDISPDDPVTYYPHAHFEGGTGSLQTWITSGDSLPISELLTLMIQESDNIAFHMLDEHFASIYGGKIASFYIAEHLDLALDYYHNVLTPHDLIMAYRLLYEDRESPSYIELIELLKNSAGPSVFPHENVSHKPGIYGSAVADAGILWLDQGPIFYAILLDGRRTDQQPLEELGNIFLATYEEITQDISEEMTEPETANTIFVTAK